MVLRWLRFSSFSSRRFLFIEPRHKKWLLGLRTIGVARNPLAAAMPAYKRAVKPGRSCRIYGIFIRFGGLLIRGEILIMLYSFFHCGLNWPTRSSAECKAVLSAELS